MAGMIRQRWAKNDVVVEDDYDSVDVKLADPYKTDQDLYNKIKGMGGFEKMLERNDEWEINDTLYTREELERGLSAKEIYFKKQAKLLADVPEEFHGVFSKHAWDEGHAYGYDEVLNHLEELVDIFRNPIKEYAARLKREH